MGFLPDVPVLHGSLARLEPLSPTHAADLAVAAEEGCSLGWRSGSGWRRDMTMRCWQTWPGRGRVAVRLVHGEGNCEGSQRSCPARSPSPGDGRSLGAQLGRQTAELAASSHGDDRNLTRNLGA